MAKYAQAPSKTVRKQVKANIKHYGGQYSPRVQKELAKRKGVKAAKSSGVSATRAARQTKIAQKVNQQAGRNARAAVKQRAKKAPHTASLIRHASKVTSQKKGPRPHVSLKAAAYHAASEMHNARSRPGQFGKYAPAVAAVVRHVANKHGAHV